MYTAEMEKTIPQLGPGETCRERMEREKVVINQQLLKNSASGPITGSQVPDRSVSLSLIGLLGDLERRDARCPSFLSDIHTVAQLREAVEAAASGR